MTTDYGPSMVYIDSQGQVHESRPWSFTSVTDLFWGFVTFVTLFFRTLVNPDANRKGDGHSTDYRSNGGRGPPPAGPRRRFGGFGGTGGAPAAPPFRGGGG